MTQNRRFSMFFIIMFFPVLFFSQAGAELPGQSQKEKDIPSLIVRANEAYKNRLYDDAILLYEQVTASGYRNGHLFYNRGNTYFRTGEIGKAILWYKKALLLLPRNEDLQANLSYARKQTKDHIEKQESSWSQILFFWVYAFTFHEFIIIFLFVHCLVFACAGIKRFVQGDAIQWAFIFLLGIYLITGGSLICRYGIEKNNNQGVVLAKEVNIKSGIGSDTVTLFKLHEGAEVLNEETQKEWIKIILSDGKKGWVEGRFIAF